MRSGRPSARHVGTVARCGAVAAAAIAALAACSHGGGPGAASASPGSTIVDTRPKAGAPKWCDALDNPAVTALPTVLPQLLTPDGAAAGAKVHEAATAVRAAAPSAPADVQRLLTAAADALDTAADQRSATSLQAVDSSFTALGKGVQDPCGFH